jgi:hypothetical protein
VVWKSLWKIGLGSMNLLSNPRYPILSSQYYIRSHWLLLYSTYTYRYSSLHRVKIV